MHSDPMLSVAIHTSPEEVPSIPPWFAEIVLLARYFTQQGYLDAISQHVRLARGRAGTFDVLDFVAILLGEFSQYLDSKEKPDLVADGVTYSKVAMYLSDEEFLEMGKRLNETLGAIAENPPAPGRRRRVFSTIVLPAPDESAP